MDYKTLRKMNLEELRDLHRYVIKSANFQIRLINKMQKQLNKVNLEISKRDILMEKTIYKDLTKKKTVIRRFLERKIKEMETK